MSERSRKGKEGRGGEGTHVAPTAVVASPAAGPSAKNKPSVRSLPADATTATPWLARYSAMIWVGELLVQLTTLPSETLMTSTPSCTARIMAATICEGSKASGAVEVEGEAVEGGREERARTMSSLAISLQPVICAHLRPRQHSSKEIRCREGGKRTR